MKKLALFTALVCCMAVLGACAETEPGSSTSTAPSSTTSMEESTSSADDSSSTTRPSASSSRPIASSSSSSRSQAPPASSSSRDTASSSQPAPTNPPASQQPAQPPASSSQAPPPAPPAPPPQEPAPPPPQPSGPYAYPFDVAQIQSDMIAWGQAAGMTHEAGARTPDNSSWDNPITASESFQGDILAQKLKEYVQFYTSASWQGYGNEPVTHFTIYVSGTTFYVLH